RIQQTADATLATFSDDVHRVAQGKLGEFGESANAKAADIRAQVDTAARETAEEFGHSLNRRLEDQIATARQSLEKLFQQVFAQWQAQRDARSQEWQQALTRLAGESVEQYKQRLENTSNTWILAAAANFNQQGQTLLESFSRNADERLRQACAGVFSGLADAMRDRLMGLSTELTRKPEDEKK
ncbi:MAG TPA: hypothetical protein VGA40_01705, partial [Candidatus Acidoferrales bacterium]